MRSNSRVRSVMPVSAVVPPRADACRQQRTRSAKKLEAEVIELAQIKEYVRPYLAIQRLQDGLDDPFFKIELDSLSGFVSVMTVRSPWCSRVNASSMRQDL